MRSTGAFALFALAVGLHACSTESLTRRAPKLDLTVYTTGQAYDSIDETAMTIALGQVPVYATKWAIFQMSNPTQVPLKIDGIYATESVGLRWQEAHWLDFETVDASARERPFDSPAAGSKVYDCNLVDLQCEAEAPTCDSGQVPGLVNGCDVSCIDPKACVTEIPAFGVYLLGIAYQPLEVGDHHVVLEVHSNAANATVKTLTVTGTAVFTGAPDLEVHYNDYDGPAATDCTGAGCVIADANALSFGNIGLGAVGTVTLTIKNGAQCQAFIGVDPCNLCGLTVDKDAAAYNLGIGFKPGTNDDGKFTFGASTRVPFDILQRNLDCADAINPNRRAEGFVNLLINFTAPMVEGEFHSTLVIESSDPTRPVLEIPIVAYARNAPIAIAGLRAFDPHNPSAPYSDARNLQPLKRAYFDGRLSYDPAVCPACASPSDPACVLQRTANPTCGIAGWEWKVLEFPVGTDAGMFQHQGADSPLYSFWLPLAGKYVIGLTVWNADAIRSGDTVDSKVEIDVIPGSRIHIQLTWDDPQNDQDLHLLKLPEANELCDEPWDCYFSNKQPVWFSSSSAGVGPNPRLDIDDTDGLGPENTNIDSPEPGTYRIAVHYWSGHGSAESTRNTVRVYLNGLQVAEYRRTMTQYQKWLIADIVWNADGNGSLTPYPSDVAGQVGAISTFPDSNCGGSGF